MRCHELEEKGKKRFSQKLTFLENPKKSICCRSPFLHFTWSRHKISTSVLSQFIICQSTYSCVQLWSTMQIFNLCSSVVIGLKQNHLPYNKQNRILKFFKRRKISWYEKIALKKDTSGPSGVGKFFLTLLTLSPDAYSRYSRYRTFTARTTQRFTQLRHAGNLQSLFPFHLLLPKRNGLNTTWEKN